MSYITDFHIHSYFSDGTMKPTDIVRMYKDKEFDMISITDHDNIDGVNEAVIAGEALKIKVVPGIEFSTVDQKGHELHLLGYYFDIENEKLLEKLKELKETRKDRNVRLLEALNQMGYELKEEDLIQRPKQKYIGKPNFAMALLKKGYINSLKEAFAEGEFLESDKARSIKREKMSIYEAIELLKGAGGMAVVAHPMKIKGLGEKGSDQFFENLDSLIRELKKAGLKGLECYHPSASDEESIRLVDIAGKYHLHITEGSDFHGPEFE